MWLIKTIKQNSAKLHIICSSKYTYKIYMKVYLWNDEYASLNISLNMIYETV